MAGGTESEYTRGISLLEGAVGSYGRQSGEYGLRVRCSPYPSLVSSEHGAAPTTLVLTVGHQAVILVLVQLDEGGVPAAVRCTEPAGSLCLPGWGQQCKEAFIFGGREGAAWSGGRN